MSGYRAEEVFDGVDGSLGVPDFDDCVVDSAEFEDITGL